MGHRMRDEPHVYGDDCIACFGAGETPKYIYVRFSQIKKCDPHNPPVCKIPPNDQVFKLTQDDSVPCLFRYSSSDWIINFLFSWGFPAKDRLSLFDGLGWIYFNAVEPPCSGEGHTFNNLLTCAGSPDCAHGGFATVTWTQEATELLESINMQRSDDLFMEMHPLVDGNRVYKFCRLRDATNIKIEFEPD